MRILHVAQPVDGGVAAYVLAACADQLARGWRVAVACPDGGRLADGLAAAGIPRLRWTAGRNPGPGSMAEARRLADGSIGDDGMSVVTGWLSQPGRRR